MIPIIIALIFALGGLGGYALKNDQLFHYDGNKAEERLSFGATNFPTSLDSLTNPAATDSVATVSHSSQHANANDAIEAIEAKLGTGASTAVADSIFVGDGAGTSRFSTFATSTRFTATNFLATGSSTLQNFTAANGTTTNATSTTLSVTKLVATNATTTSLATTNASTTNFYGADLTTCSGSNFLQWSTTGRFSCGAASGATINFVSTTSAQDLATTTIRSIPEGEILTIRFYLATTTTNANLRLCFNEDWKGCNATEVYYSSASSKDGGAIGADSSLTSHAVIGVTNSGTQERRGWGVIEMYNSTSTRKIGNGQMTYYNLTGGVDHITEFGLDWASTTSAINQVSFSLGGTALIGSGSFFYIQAINP